MVDRQPTLKIGYVVKMFPRLSETFILNEILELERRGAEVVIFSVKKPNEGRFHPQLTKLKAKVLYLEDLEPKKWHLWISKEWSQLSDHSQGLWNLIDESLSNDNCFQMDHIWWSAWLAAQAEKMGLDHLHAHFASLPSSIAYFAHRISGISFSFTAHAKDIFVYDADEHHLRKKLKSAAFVVTVTNYNKKYLTKNIPEADPDSIRVVHNGINLEQFRDDVDIDRKPNTILAVGRLVVKKGFGDLLDACALLKTRGVEFDCTIVGEGPEEELLRAKCIELGLNGTITFAGALTIDEVMSLMQTSTLFCLPCVTAPDNNVDALPTVLLESLASGLPSISTTVSGIPEIIDSGTDGVLVSPNDPQALSAQLACLLESPELRTRLATKGREKAEKKFDLSQNAGTLFEMFLALRTMDETTESPVVSERITARNGR